MNDNNIKVCRLCLKLISEKEKHYNINYVEPLTGFMPFRDKITTCVPELALDIFPECYICLTCAESLKTAYEFKNNCLKIEEKVKYYYDNISTDSNFDLLNLSSFVKEKNDDIDDPGKLDEDECVEYTNINEYNESLKTPKKNLITDIENIVTVQCSICDELFKNTKELIKHKKLTHNSPFMCNFCNEEFKNLYVLRQHNTLCKKKDEIPWSTQRRPHLPTKAKIVLKEWLYLHHEHPYPADYEKQCLMKETNLTLIQIENWFINARRRLLNDFSRRRCFHKKLKERSIKKGT